MIAALLLLASPVLLLRAIQTRRRRGEPGSKILPPLLADTLAHYAAAMVRGPQPAGGWGAVARGVDRYLCATRSPRVWRIPALLVLMELAPLLAFQPPFRFLSPAARRRFVDRHLHAPRGLFRLVAAGGQLVRLGYYAQPEAAARMGCPPVGRRTARRERRRGRLAPEAVAAEAVA